MRPPVVTDISELVSRLVMPGMTKGALIMARSRRPRLSVAFIPRRWEKAGEDTVAGAVVQKIRASAIAGVGSKAQNVAATISGVAMVIQTMAAIRSPGRAA